MPLDQLAAEVERLRLQLAEAADAQEKLTAAVAHRDGVIAQLAASRKQVFDAAHRACADNQAELHQMQGALHKVSRQLSNERREHAARTRELRRQIKALAASKPALGAVAVPVRRGGSDSSSAIRGDGVPATPTGFPYKRRPATSDATDDEVDLCVW
jgi:anti-sigma factor RsiW